jgi:hypothetical protein
MLAGLIPATAPCLRNFRSQAAQHTRCCSRCVPAPKPQVTPYTASRRSQTHTRTHLLHLRFIPSQRVISLPSSSTPPSSTAASQSLHARPLSRPAVRATPCSLLLPRPPLLLLLRQEPAAKTAPPLCNSAAAAAAASPLLVKVNVTQPAVQLEATVSTVLLLAGRTGHQCCGR